MTFRQHLAKTELVAVAALLAVAIVFAGISAIRTSASPNDIFSPSGAAIVVLAYTLAIGCIPVVVFGAPLYAWLTSIKKATWLTAVAIGLAPGLVFLLVAQDLGLWSMTCGAVVALTTHAICRRP